MTGRAFAWGGAIAVPGGPGGPGGAEFRLPVLPGVFAPAAHQAVRLDLPVSLATPAVAATARPGVARVPGLSAHGPGIAALAAGAVAAAWLGTGLLARLPAGTRRPGCARAGTMPPAA